MAVNSVVNMATELTHEHALELARIQVNMVRSSGVRSDHVGIEAMCQLAGLRDEPAVMPAFQAIKYVNIVMGQSSVSKSQRNNGSSDRSGGNRRR